MNRLKFTNFVTNQRVKLCNILHTFRFFLFLCNLDYRKREKTMKLFKIIRKKYQATLSSGVEIQTNVHINNHSIRPTAVCSHGCFKLYINSWDSYLMLGMCLCVENLCSCGILYEHFCITIYSVYCGALDLYPVGKKREKYKTHIPKVRSKYESCTCT